MDFLIYLIFIASIFIHEAGHFILYRVFSNWHSSSKNSVLDFGIKHFSLIGTLLVPVTTYYLVNPVINLPIFIGWLKPVRMFGASNLTSKQIMLIALSGPLANLSIAFVLLVVYLTYITQSTLLSEMVAIAITINISLFLFNLLPVKPLDGGLILSLVSSDLIKYSVRLVLLVVFLYIVVSFLIFNRSY